MAKDIQLNLLPKAPPRFPGYDMAAVNIPAQEIGGDYYDFIKISDNETAFCLGDISGKGLPAALLMANLQATLRGQAFIHKSPKDCITSSNVLLFHSTESNKFATLFYGILDSKNHQITFCNAGHDNPFHINREKKCCRLESSGVILGCFQESVYEEENMAVNPGDLVVIYSDGITEAMDKRGEEFGEKRLEELLCNNIILSPREIIDQIIKEVKNFTGNQPQSDDMTLVALKRD